MMQSNSLLLQVAFFTNALFLSSTNAFTPVTSKTSRITSTSTSSTSLSEMKRPILDTVASTLFKLENDRVTASSVPDSKGRIGEPMEWSEKDSFANRFSEIIASNSIGYNFKQTVANLVAGEYDEELTQQKVNDFIKLSETKQGNMFFKKEQSTIAMFSFTSCPFCRQAKDYLDENNIKYVTMELDTLDGNEGNEIRATLGKLTKRTSVPSIFVNGQPIGGLNDGMPGLLPLAKSGELETMLA